MKIQTSINIFHTHELKTIQTRKLKQGKSYPFDNVVLSICP